MLKGPSFCWLKEVFLSLGKQVGSIFLAEHPPQSQNTGADLQAFHEHRHKWIREDHVSEGGGITVYRSSHEIESANTRRRESRNSGDRRRRWSIGALGAIIRASV